MGSLWNAYGCHSDRPSLQQRSSPRRSSTLCDVCAGGALRFDTSPNPSSVGSTLSSTHLDDRDPPRGFVDFARFARVDQCRRAAIMAGARQVHACRRECRRLGQRKVFGKNHHPTRSHAQLRALSHVSHRFTNDRSSSAGVFGPDTVDRFGRVVSRRGTRQDVRSMGRSDRQLCPRQGRLSTGQHPARSGEGRLRAGNQGHPRCRDPLLWPPDRGWNHRLRPGLVVRRHRAGGACVGRGPGALCARALGARPRNQQLRWAHPVQRFHRREALGRDARRGPRGR